MANNTENVTVKTKFVDIITEGELVSSPVSATFSTIVTKASLIKTPSDNALTDGKTITTLYDKVFIDAVSYWAFTENKLQLWENTMEYKYFNTMYTNHRSLVNTIWKICQQAQQLLEGADILTGRDYILQQEIESHVSKITRTELWQRLYKPTYFHFKDILSPPSSCQNTSSSQTSSTRPVASSSQIRTAHWSHSVCSTWSGKLMRCYECNSLSHIKWNCQLYVCPLCGQRQPRHAQKNCPTKWYDDGIQGYFDIEGAETSNYSREC